MQSQPLTTLKGSRLTDRIDQIRNRLKKTRQDLFDLSDDIWNDIDHTDNEAIERGGEFMKEYNGAVDALSEVAGRINELLSTYDGEFNSSSDSKTNVTRNLDEWPDREDAALETRTLGEDVSYTYPVALNVGEFVVTGVEHWNDLYREICAFLSEELGDDFDSVVESKVFESRRNKRYLTDNPEELRKAEEVAPGIYAEMNLSANDICDRISELLDFFEVGKRPVEIMVKTRRE